MPHSRPRPDLEQYATPAVIAADMLFTALSFGDVEGRRVVDLGCGSGILSIGAALLGAIKVTGIDVDPRSIADARLNIDQAGVEVELLCKDIHDLDMKADTRVYSLHNARTGAFLMNIIRAMDATVFFHKSYKFEIPHLFEFHDRKKKEIEVVLLCISSSEVTK